jgi:hypothetical protein
MRVLGVKMTKLTNSRGYCGAHTVSRCALMALACALMACMSLLCLLAHPASPCAFLPDAVELAAAAVIIVGSRYGLPLSTTHCMVSPTAQPAACQCEVICPGPTTFPAALNPCCAPSPVSPGGCRDWHRHCWGCERAPPRGRQRQRPRIQLGPAHQVLLWLVSLVYHMINLL